MREGPCRVLIIGATSAIAEALARRLAARGHVLALSGRNAVRVEAIAKDLAVRGATSVHTGVLDVNRLADHEAFIQEALDALGAIDIAVIAHGTLPDQTDCQRSASRTLEELTTNFLSTISLLTILASKLERQGSGTIAVLTSVAGDRGRASNYVYGAAKAGVSTFLEGLRHRLHASGIRVIDIKPGFVDTPMTAGFRKGPLWSSPARVAASIERALDSGSPVLYTPWFWRWIMWVVRSLPYALFHRTRL